MACRSYFIGACCLLLTACGGASAEEIANREELEARVASLSAKLTLAQEEVSGLEEAAEEVETAQSTLTDTIARFDDEDWQDVVPDIRSAAEEVESASSDLTSRVAEVSSALE